jgi:molybdopterin converting factor small subunit
MRLMVKFAGPLRSAAGVNKIEIEVIGEPTTGAVLRQVAEVLPGIRQELFGPEPKEYYSIFVNDRLVPELEREIAPVHEGDEVLFLLPIAGGQVGGGNLSAGIGRSDESPRQGYP